jgi:hypothetical protein
VTAEVDEAHPYLEAPVFEAFGSDCAALELALAAGENGGKANR